MATFQGESGKVSMKFDTGSEQYLAHITNWSADSSLEIDTTAYFGGSETEEGFSEATPGTVSWTASIDGAIDFSATGGQDKLFDAHNSSTLIDVTLYLDEETAFTGKGYIDSYSPSHAADGKGEFSASVAGNGKLTRISA